MKRQILRIQATASTSEDLQPDEKHKTISRDYEYKRLGTISLLAGIDLQTGEAIPLVRDKHSSKEYIEFLKKLDGKYLKNDKICLVMDNLKVHTSQETRKYLATVPGRFEFVFTPKHGSWLNLVEGFFSKLTRQMLRGIRVKTKDELVQRIYKYFDEVNEEPVVYHWKYRLDEIGTSSSSIAVILPFLLIIAIDLLLELHETFFFALTIPLEVVEATLDLEFDHLTFDSVSEIFSFSFSPLIREAFGLLVFIVAASAVIAEFAIDNSVIGSVMDKSMDSISSVDIFLNRRFLSSLAALDLLQQIHSVALLYIL